MRRVFYSFHYQRDVFRVELVRNMGVLEDDAVTLPNPWEEVRRKEHDDIKQWIDNTMIKCSCIVVLIGYETASRYWVQYEIENGWNKNKGILGIYIDKLPSIDGSHDPEGSNPISQFQLKDSMRTKLSSIVPVKKHNDYKSIRNNLANWVEEAIKVRQNYPNIPCIKLK